MKRKLLILFLLVVSYGAAFAQTGKITGKILEDETGEPLIGANVVVKNTTKGTVTDLNGEFTVDGINAGEVTLVISYISFESKEITTNVKEGQTTSLGDISLKTNALGLKQVNVIASVAIDRKTPVAVSNIKAAEIESKLGNQEFPEILKVTPGVYTTKQGGGFGDSRINLRGFNSENVAVMINGVPVNDMENGRVYWSNWAGLSDVTRTMQVQRGLGASKVAVPSIGGTINILTKTTDMEKGGSVLLGTANDGYTKKLFTLSTGLMENNWAITISGGETHGDGYVDGTEFQAYSYFFNVSKIINDDHTLSLTGFGAPQRHGQRQARLGIQTYRDAPQGIRYNPDWGYLNGEVVHVEDNFYHKPQFSLNHYWTIDSKTNLSTAAYASYGTGGGGGTGGASSSDRDLFNTMRVGGSFSAIDLDAIVDVNLSNPTGEATTYMRASRNDHTWYGVLSTLDHELNSNITLLGGLDYRYYYGQHFQEVTNLLGGDYAVDRSDINEPIKVIRTGDKYSYNNDGVVHWVGGFAQAEYSKDALSGFISLAVSNTAYKRIDYFNYLDSDPLQETSYQDFIGYSAKGGVNYNLTTYHNVFANVGYFERAPHMNAVFLNYKNNINTEAQNQKITSYEIGYGLRHPKVSGNVNLYRTFWKDRTLTESYMDRTTGNIYFANILGVNALHQGVEVDVVFRPVNALRITGMASIGDWTWQNDLTDVKIFDENQVELDEVNLYIANLKVGDAAQTTAAFIVDYDISSDVTFGFTYNYFDNLFADYDPNDRGDESKIGVQPWELPSYSLFDANLTYRFKIANLESSIYGNVYNLFDTEYIAEGNDGANNNASTASVYYGLGRTWSLGMKIKF